MALEAVVYQQGHFSNRDLYTLLDNWSWDYSSEQQQQQNQYFQQHEDQNVYLEAESLQYYEWGTPNSSSDTQPIATSSSRQPKKRRARIKKNKEDIENQRMTHIAVERNRRKQMNEYLSVLKSLMPDSYVQRGDQASIVGGAINFVKELEQNLHNLSSQKIQINPNSMESREEILPFEEFFCFRQYSTTRVDNEASSVADVEVIMVDSHANLKIRSRKHPKQLLKLVTGLQELKLSILYLNVSTKDQLAFYSLSLRVEDDSQLNSADEIATSVHQLLGRIQEGSSSSSMI